MDNKRRSRLLTLLVAVIVIAIAVASISAVVAYMLRRSDEIKNTFIPADVNFKVVESFEDGAKTSVKVQNTGNIDSYVRIRVVTYWQDSKGNVVARTSPEVKFDTTWTYNTDAWIYDAQEQTFYYKEALGAHDTTDELLNLEGSFTGIKLTPVTETLNNIDFVYHPVIEFVTEGIQSNPTQAVKDAWKVTVDANVNITAIP